MKKLFYIGALSALLLTACSEADYPIPEDKVIKTPVYDSDPIEIPTLTDEDNN